MTIRVGVLGAGKVGKAIMGLYQRPSYRLFVKDTNMQMYEQPLADLDVLNICIPYSNEFSKIVELEVEEAGCPKLVIIHSTVLPTTTREIASRLPKQCSVVHSPVRGPDEYLEKSLYTFVKYIGAETQDAAIAAYNHLEALGLNLLIRTPAIVTELGKLLSTTYYGLCIAWHGEVKQLCDKYKVPFEQVATEFNLTYNEGYQKLGLLNVVRPTLFPPPADVIGGNCVIQNAKNLSTVWQSKALDLILQYSGDVHP